MDLKQKKIVVNLGIFGTHGIDRAAIELMRELTQLGHEVYLHLIYERIEKSFLYSKIPDSVKVVTAMPLDSFWGSIHMTRYKNLWNKLLDSVGIFKMQTIIADSINRLQPDIIFDFDISLQKTINALQAPVIGSIHFNPKLVRGGNHKRLKRMGHRLKKYKLVVMLCDEMLDQAKEIWPMAENKFVVIPNPVNQDLLLKQASDPLNLSEKIKKHEYFINVARLTGQKDISTLLYAYSLAKKSGVHWPLVLIGDGDESDFLKNLSKELKINEDVFFLGHINNPRPHVKHAGCFVLSSDNEGLPTILIEAQMLGCPIISTACSTGPKDILDNGELGVLVPVKDSFSLSEAMIKMYGHSEIRSKFVTKGLKHSTQYLPKKITEDYLNLAFS